MTLRAVDLRAGVPADLVIRIGTDGGRTPLEPVMDAYAHLVAFDEKVQGYAHLHPLAVDPLAPVAAVDPELAFKVTFPQPGRYVIWAQAKRGGRELFQAFPVEVAAKR